MSIKNILIVEDEPIVSNYLKRHLQVLKYNVVGVVESGEDALCFLKNKKADVILMDIVLNGRLDGISTAEQIVSTHNLPILFMTGHMKNENQKRINKLNPLAVFIKPFNAVEIKEVLTEHTN